MQQLADIFYLSKTAVALEIDTVKRWIDRYAELDLEISGTKGIRILASEKRKRIYCATVSVKLPPRGKDWNEYLQHRQKCRDKER